LTEEWTNAALQFAFATLAKFGEYVQPPIDKRTFRFLPTISSLECGVDPPVLLLQQVYSLKVAVQVGSLVVPAIPLVVNLDVCPSIT
jgi:hypothetical protein